MDTLWEETRKLHFYLTRVMLFPKWSPPTHFLLPSSRSLPSPATHRVSLYFRRSGCGEKRRPHVSIKPSSCVSITSSLHPSLLGKTKSFLQDPEGFWWASCQRTPLGLHSKESLGPQVEKCSVVWCPSLVAFPGATGHLYKQNAKAETLPRN